MSPTRPVLGVLDDRSGDPDFCLTKSGWDEFARLNAPLARPRAWTEPLRDSKLERSSVPCGTSLSSEAMGVKPAPYVKSFFLFFFHDLDYLSLVLATVQIAIACMGMVYSD